jgi:hypothetical protein
MDKRGISAVVSVVLMLSLVLAVAVIVWVVITNVVNDATDEISIGRVSLDLKILSVKVNSGDLIVDVRREKGRGDLIGLKFIVSDENDEELVNVEDVKLEEFESEKFTLSLSELRALNVVEVSVAPVLASGTADIKDTWEKSGDIECVPIDCPDASEIQCGISLGEDGCGGSCGGEGTKCGAGEVCESGICVQMLRIFVTSESYPGNFGLFGESPTEVADNLCKQDNNNPLGIGNGKWKALIATTERRLDKFGGTDWVLEPNQAYYNLDGQLIDTTDPDAWFTFDFENVIYSESQSVWTGLTNLGDFYSAYACSSWTSFYPSGAKGIVNSNTSSSIIAGVVFCNNLLKLYCVEQPST